MTEKDKLQKELIKLSKRANQRILRLERLTGMKEPFAVKQLFDYLSVENAISKTGRIRTSKKFTETQMINIIKATKEFLEDKENSLVSNIKKAKIEAEKSIGIKLKWDLFESTYQASKLYNWAEETFGSAFWKYFAPQVKEMGKDSWVNMCASYVENIHDTDVLNKLRALYDILKSKG